VSTEAFTGSHSAQPERSSQHTRRAAARYTGAHIEHCGCVADEASVVCILVLRLPAHGTIRLNNRPVYRYQDSCYRVCPTQHGER